MIPLRRRLLAEFLGIGLLLVRGLFGRLQAGTPEPVVPRSK
ncbi:hypothetical protein [Nonomuraea rhizosphaerae]|nr:hypothetical protein [Nonomuraea rhizosphaerae]